jgi:hypothetical protein
MEAIGVHEITVSSTQEMTGIHKLPFRRFQIILSSQIPRRNQIKNKG